MNGASIHAPKVLSSLLVCEIVMAEGFQAYAYVRTFQEGFPHGKIQVVINATLDESNHIHRFEDIKYHAC